MTAWDELQTWLIMNVGSKEAEECNALVNRIVADARREKPPEVVTFNNPSFEQWAKDRVRDRKLNEPYKPD